jgi:sugar O-acyltransferase (sialic acid O-acetyltransferase NeuD family)
MDPQDRSDWRFPYDEQDAPARIVIVASGRASDQPIADVAYELLTDDSPYEVAAFAVERKYLSQETHLGLPAVPFQTVQEQYPPQQYGMFVAVGYRRLNHLRARLYHQTKEKGYTLISYVSSKASLWSSVAIGDNCFIMEQNLIHRFVEIDNDVTLWSGNHVSRHVTIRDHVYVASQVVIGEGVEVGAYSVLDYNAVVRRGAKVAADCLIGPGAVVGGETHERRMYFPTGMARDVGMTILSGAPFEWFWPEEG